MKEKIANKETRSAEGIIADIRIMLATEGWRIIKEIMDENIVMLNHKILEKTANGEPDGPVLDDKSVDELRYKRVCLMDLNELPARYIEKLTEDDTPEENFDPYFKSPEELIKEKKNK
jgi:hypothetical protein